ncbi:MAG: COX15/CtaA family protein [Bacteroidetes bacterium]|nr:COX15/CtaA family protein [Bacteroidota bacterium]
MSSSARKWIGLWLIAGCVMVFAQVIIGGVTRLTGSGLSITKWDIVVGAIPPLTESSWTAEFAKYQQTPQYQQINQDMTLSEFKFIYFWEFFHRNNARLMGVIFFAGLIFFIIKGWMNKDLALRLAFVLVWGILIATLGWIMVASGLIDKPYVSPVKLSMHLTTALVILANLVWLTLYVLRDRKQYGVYAPRQKRIALAVMILLFIQLFLGGIVSGSKAGLAYPTWPDMNGQWIPSALTSLPVRWDGILYYDAGAHWEQTFIQFVHRCTAYVLVIVVIWFFFQLRGLSAERVFSTGVWFFPLVVLLQASIGIITVLHCVGHVPVFWGVLHQAGAMLLLANTTFIYYHLRASKA